MTTDSETSPLLAAYTAWISVFSICFTFLPFSLVQDWRRRGTSDGFSSVNLVLPVLTMSCWFLHGLKANDTTNIALNAVNIPFFLFYIGVYAYYQPKRHWLILQLAALGAILTVIVAHISSYENEHEGAHAMGSIAAGMQIAGLAGGIYEIRRTISLGHTEYVPALINFAIFSLTVQWLIFGVWTGNMYIAVSNIAGLAVNIATISLFFVYPPLTWRVPIFGIEPQGKKKE